MTTQTPILYATEPLTGDSYKLLELPNEIISILKSQDTLLGCSSICIKGDPSQEAVLCTQNNTYAIRQVQQSNSILLLSREDDGSLLVRDSHNSILELVPTRPRLDILSNLLRKSEWDGLESINRLDVRLYTFHDILEAVQASERELRDGLDEIQAVEIDGHYRVLADTYVIRLIDTVITLAVIEDTIGKSSTVEEVMSKASCHENVAGFLLRRFGEDFDDGRRLSVEKFSVYIGLNILKTMPKQPTDVFLQQWKERLPDQFDNYVNLSLLKGECLIDDKGMIMVFSRKNLPQEPGARFQDLFMTREKWIADEMRPFISDLVPAKESKKLDALIMKYVRAQKMPDGKIIWSSRVKFM